MSVTPARMYQRRRTAAQWTAENPVLSAGEIGVVSDTSPPEFKIGDGTTAWVDLAQSPSLVAEEPLEVDLATVGDVTTLTLTDYIARRTVSKAVGQYFYSGTDIYGGNAYTLNTLYLRQVVLPAGTMDRIGIEVSAALASATVRLGVYTDSGGLPLTRIAEATTGVDTYPLDAAATGAKTAAIAAAIPTNGVYWLASVNQGAVCSVQHAARGWMLPIPLGTAVPSGTTCPQTRTVTGVTSALPATISGLTNTITSHNPRIHYRYSS